MWINRGNSLHVLTEGSLLTILLFVAAVNQPAAVRAEQEGTRPEPFGFVFTSDAQRTLLHWFECDHCPPELLDRVVRLGPGVIPYLHAALVQGPTLVTLLNATRFLHRQYGKLVDYKISHPASSILPTQRDYVATHLSHLKVQYQVQAARALGAIGTPVAKTILETALQSTTSSTVKAVINDELKKTKVGVR
jgi:hypothetical protein